ncbi:MAG TPA: dienelactone hydrolase family protein [Vicinamibacterales bacterium]
MTSEDPHARQPVRSAGARVSSNALVAVLLHGRNAGPADILGLADRFARPGLTCLAPAAAGRTWYPQSFLAPRTQNEPYLSSALASVGRVVDDVAALGVPTRRIVIVGFSQGACLAAEFVYRRADRLGALLAFSGGLIGPPGTAWTRTASFGDMPAFFGCSDVDAHVPRARVEETAGVFAALGARVTPRIYPGMGHLVNEDEIACARAIFDEIGGDRLSRSDLT